MLILPLLVYKLHMRTDTTKSLIALCMMRRLIMTHNLAPGEATKPGNTLETYSCHPASLLLPLRSGYTSCPGSVSPRITIKVQCRSCPLYQQGRAGQGGKVLTFLRSDPRAGAWVRSRGYNNYGNDLPDHRYNYTTL